MVTIGNVLDQLCIVIGYGDADHGFLGTDALYRILHESNVYSQYRCIKSFRDEQGSGSMKIR
jgi:hypothetical protein